MPIELRWTTAGRTALADGDSRGTRAVEVRSIQIGSGRGAGGAADDGRTALRTLQATAAATGTTQTAGRIAVQATFAPSSSYSVSEVGIIGGVGDAGPDLLLAYWTDTSETVARADAGVTLALGVVIDVAAASASVTVTLSPNLTLMTHPIAGIVQAYAGAVVPAGYLECDGSAVSRTTYAALYAAIGTTYGAGDGSTTFGLPDLARRTIAGAGGAATPALGNAVGAEGGAEEHTLTVSEIPAHDHGGHTPSAGSHSHGSGYTAVSGGSHTHSVGVHYSDEDDFRDDPEGAYQNREIRSRISAPPRSVRTSSGGAHSHGISGSSTSGGAHSHGIPSQGGGGGHSILQPTVIMRWIISTG